MQLFLDWRCPTSVEPASLPGVTSTLVQSGIKVFLHQRNQIPLPLEQMVARQGVSASTPPPLETGMDVENTDAGEGEGSDPRDRIRRMVSQRRAKHLSSRKMKSSGRLRKLEEEGVKCINQCLMVLDNAIRLNLEHFVAIGMFFGTSVHSPKETIIFDLLGTHKVSEGARTREGALQAKSSASGLSAILRSFHKSIIMSEEFCEITDKNLVPTRTNICFLMSKECDFKAEDIEQGYFPVIMEDCAIFEDYLSERLNFSEAGLASNSNASCDMSVSICSDEVPFETSLVEHDSPSIDNSVGCDQKPIKKRNKKSLCIKMTVPSVEETCTKEVNVFNYKNLFCYQIPLRFKGIAPCKNRR